MTNWQYDQKKKSGTLFFKGDLTISQVSDIKDRLLEVFDVAEQVQVDASAVTSVDVAGIQLLYACHRFSTDRGKQMILHLGDNTIFDAFLAEVGFSRTFICSSGKEAE